MQYAIARSLYYVELTKRRRRKKKSGMDVKAFDKCMFHSITHKRSSWGLLFSRKQSQSSAAIYWSRRTTGQLGDGEDSESEQHSDE